MGLYFPPTYIRKYYDERRIYEIMSDTGIPATPGSYLINDAYLEAIRSAEAEVDENLQVGRHYDKQTFLDACSAADAALPSNPSVADAQAAELAKRRVAPLREMIAHLVFGKLMARRGYAAEKMRSMAPMYDTALERLERLASGQKVFDFASNLSAGVPRSILTGSKIGPGANFNPMFGVWSDQGYNGLYGTNC